MLTRRCPEPEFRRGEQIKDSVFAVERETSVVVRYETTLGLLQGFRCVFRSRHPTPVAGMHTRRLRARGSQQSATSYAVYSFSFLFLTAVRSSTLFLHVPRSFHACEPRSARYGIPDPIIVMRLLSSGGVGCLPPTRRRQPRTFWRKWKDQRRPGLSSLASTTSICAPSRGRGQRDKATCCAVAVLSVTKPFFHEMR